MESSTRPDPIKAPLRIGMIGGGEGAFIGPIHRAAMRLDGLYELVCGALSSEPTRAGRSAAAIGIPRERAYADYGAMIRQEAAMNPATRAEAVVIATPNNLHLPIARMALEHGFHVFCEKPMTLDLAEAKALRDVALASGRVFGLAHAYCGYPLVVQAKRLVAAGRIGDIRRIVVEYPQGWLARPEERLGSKQAAWRTSAATAGTGAIGDIGTHAFQLAEFVSGDRAVELRAELNSMVAGRAIDDEAVVELRLQRGGKVLLTASQVATGEENGLRIRLYGALGSLSWRQEQPNSLWLHRLDKPAERWRAGSNAAYLDPDIRSLCRTPMGHPEGYIEALANLYRHFADRIRATDDKHSQESVNDDFPDIEAGFRGMAFLDAAVASSQDGGRWKALYA